MFFSTLQETRELSRWLASRHRSRWHVSEKIEQLKIICVEFSYELEPKVFNTSNWFGSRFEPNRRKPYLEYLSKMKLVFKLLKGVYQHRKLVATEQPTEGELASSDEESNAVEDELEILAILIMPIFLHGRDYYITRHVVDDNYNWK